MKYFVEFIRTAFEPVGLVGISVCEGNNVDEVLSWAWNAYNRGSGYEVPFAGPSASVDDIFRVRQADGHPGIYELHVVAPFGFKRVDRYADRGTECPKSPTKKHVRTHDTDAYTWCRHCGREMEK